jgi:hypothetical protein
MSRVEWVRQEERYGCVVACLAMATARTYADVRRYFNRPFDEGGMKNDEAYHYLATHGYAVAHLDEACAAAAGLEWPPPPFARAHLASVYTDARPHMVVVAGDGRVLDPSFEPAIERSLHDYERVRSVAGIYMIGGEAW